MFRCHVVKTSNRFSPAQPFKIDNVMPVSFLRRPLVRDLTVVLAVKILVIALAAVFLFGPGRRPHIDHAAVLRHFFDRNS